MTKKIVYAVDPDTGEATSVVVGESGGEGSPGLSAYQIAVNNGFSGTEAEWLISLRGTDGPTGPQGLKGDKGDTGNTGPQGLPGSDGAQGLPGADGPQGPKGDTGDQGPQGVQGEQGPIGLTGPAGADGAQGIQGVPGNDGADGATGPEGPEGPQGDVGPQGPSGSGPYALLANGATAMAFGTNGTVKVTPTANATYTTIVPAAGIRCTLIILTSGTTSRTITFGSGFKPVGTLATGTVSGRVFVINWISDGTNLYEAGRTAAMVA